MMRRTILLGLLALLLLNGVLAQESDVKPISLAMDKEVVISGGGGDVVITPHDRQKDKDTCNVFIDGDTLTLQRFIPTKSKDLLLMYYGVDKAGDCVVHIRSDKTDIQTKLRTRQQPDSPSVEPLAAPFQEQEIEFSLHSGVTLALVNRKPVKLHAIDFDLATGEYVSDACKISLADKTAWLKQGEKLSSGDLTLEVLKVVRLDERTFLSGSHSRRLKHCEIRLTSERGIATNKVAVSRTDNKCDLLDTLYYTPRVTSTYMDSKIYVLDGVEVPVSLAFFSLQEGGTYSAGATQSVATLVVNGEPKDIGNGEPKNVVYGKTLIVDLDLQKVNLLAKKYGTNYYKLSKEYKEGIYIGPYFAYVQEEGEAISSPKSFDEIFEDEEYTAAITLADWKPQTYVQLCINHELKKTQAPNKPLTCEERCLVDAQACWRNSPVRVQEDDARKQALETFAITLNPGEIEVLSEEGERIRISALLADEEVVVHVKRTTMAEELIAEQHCVLSERESGWTCAGREVEVYEHEPEIVLAVGDVVSFTDVPLDRRSLDSCGKTFAACMQACQPVVEVSPVRKPSGVDKITCDVGCFDDATQTCIPTGSRLIRENKIYCKKDGSLMDQKEKDATCLNHHECITNFCKQRQCKPKPAPSPWLSQNYGYSYYPYTAWRTSSDAGDKQSTQSIPPTSGALGSQVT